MDYHQIVVTKETRPDKYPCSAMSEMVVVPQLKDFTHEDLYVDDTQTHTAFVVDQSKFKQNRPVRTFLMCTYMLAFLIKHVTTITKKHTVTVLYDVRTNVIDKLQTFFPEAIFETEKKDKIYDFVFSDKKKIDETLNFHYGMFLIKINESSLLNFYLGTMMVVPFCEYYDNTVGFLVRKSKTKIITYETKFLTEFLEKSKQKQILYTYYNPYMGKIQMDLLPGIPCTYNYMYTLFVLLLADTLGISRRMDELIQISDVGQVLANFKKVFEKEDTGFAFREEKIEPAVLEPHPDVDEDATVMCCSTITSLNYFLETKKFVSFFLFHTSKQIESLSTPSSISKFNYTNTPLEMINDTGSLYTKVDMDIMVKSLKNSSIVLLTYGTFLKTLIRLTKIYQLKRFDNCSLRFCDNIVFCNAEFISQEMFVCHAALHNLRFHGAILPNLMYQANATKPKPGDFSLGFANVAIISPRSILNDVKPQKGDPVELIMGTEDGKKNISSRNITTLYYHYFAPPVGSSVMITTPNIYSLGFLENNFTTVTRQNIKQEPKTQINFNLNRTKKERSFILGKLLENGIQPVELTFLNNTTRDRYLREIANSIVVRDGYVMTADISEITDRVFGMWPLFSKGFHRAIENGASAFMFCVLAAIYQDYEDFVRWDKFSQIQNITEYELSMVYKYFVYNNSSIWVTSKLEPFASSNFLNLEPLKKILLRLSNFCAQKHTKLDQNTNFVEFINLLKTKNILDLNPVEVGSTYVIPSNKQFLTYNMVLPISYVESKPQANRMSRLTQYYTEIINRLVDLGIPEFQALVWASIVHDGKKLDLKVTTDLVYTYLEQSDGSFSISQTFSEFCTKNKIDGLMFRNVIRDLDSFCRSRSVLYNPERSDELNDAIQQSTAPIEIKGGVGKSRMMTLNQSSNLATAVVSYTLRSFITLFS